MNMRQEQTIKTEVSTVQCEADSDIWNGEVVGIAGAEPA